MMQDAPEPRFTQPQLEQPPAGPLAKPTAPPEKTYVSRSTQVASPTFPPPQQAHDSLSTAAVPELEAAALYGLAGQVVQSIAPHTEAHPASLLLQLLTAFGNMVGHGPHCMVGETRHALNLFVVLVGDSSKARKGSSWHQIARLLEEFGNPWMRSRVNHDRVSAVGLSFLLRDRRSPPADNRLLVLCEDSGSVLSALKHDKGQLAPLLRAAWDSGNLPILDPRNPVRATGAHLSLIVHTTQRELVQNLTNDAAHNGFGNRCLWACVRRSQCLPEGGSPAEADLLACVIGLRHALHWATAKPEILLTRNAAARALWQERYPDLSQLHAGLRGAATSRAEAQVLWLSAIYATLDSTSTITRPHLEAALAVWNYCSASAALLFGLSTGDPIADRIREAIEASGNGLTRQNIRRLFSGHIDTQRLNAALDHLESLQAIESFDEPTAGRPSTRWSRTPPQEATSSPPAGPGPLSTVAL